MDELAEIRAALRHAPTRALEATLVRCVAMQPLTKPRTPDYLFTSGKANRFNPAEVHCVYFAEDERTARTEYGRRLAGCAALQPIGTYFAEVRLAKVLDLADPKTRAIMQVKAADLSLSWHRRKKPIRTQLIGLGISQQRDISGIRFPSDAARAAGFPGFNVVIFPDAIRKPEFVKILGPTKAPLQQWP